MVDLERLPRWIHSSVANYFKTGLQNRGVSIPIVIEESDRIETVRETAELYINGPFINNPSNGVYIIEIDITILLNIIQTDQDLYRIQRVIGYFLPLFNGDIPIYKYGSDDEDDQSLVDCLRSFQERSNDIVVMQYGTIAPDSRMTQTVIGSIYKLILSDR